MSRSLPLLLLAVVAVAASLALVSAGVPQPYNYQTRWFPAKIDNFNWADSEKTFPLRYLYNDEFYKPGGPIFFYTGNEAAIDLFCNNTGFMWDLAPEFDAMIVFAEHRYYGLSLPFGADSFTNANYVHFSAEQALADYARLITSLKFNMTLPTAKVITFGGSYGGMLSAWFRRSYPHVVAGAIAGSAPIWAFDSLSGDFDAGFYARKASQDFKDVSPVCFANIGASWAAMAKASATKAGRDELADILGLCPNSRIPSVDVLWNTTFPWVANVYATLPMGDYPYPSTFLGPLPANPVNVACDYFVQEANVTDADLFRMTRKAMDLFYNFTGQAGKCHDIAAEQGIASLGGGTQWDYQTCTELIIPQGQYGLPHDLFYAAPWNLTQWKQYCVQTFGVNPDQDWILTQFGGPDGWDDATNIVFSNGNLDPWGPGGVNANISATVIAVPVIGGAHHLDLRSSNPADPQGVIDARNIERYWIRQFLANPNPPADPVTDDSDSGLSKKAVALISVFGTLAGCIIAFALYLCLCKPKASSINDAAPGQTGQTYRSM